MTEPVKDFDSFYTVKMLPFLQALDHERSAVKNWKGFTIATGMGTVLCFILGYGKILPSGTILAAGMLLLFFTGAFFWGRYNDRYLEDFKEKIIRQVIQFIAPSAVYKPMGFVSKKEYKASGLYRRRFTHFEGDDFWQCTYQGVSFHCSELQTWYEDMAGKGQIFKGLFFIAGISTSFSGATYIWPRGKSQLASSMADEEYRMFPMPAVQKMKVNHETFGKHFSVYSTNAAEAALILSYQMPDQMLAIKEKLKKDISFSFVRGKCYMAIPFEENLLEPDDKNPVDREAIKNYFYSVLLVFNIIRKLGLSRLT